MLEPIDRSTEADLLESVDPDEMNRHLDVFEELTRVSGTPDEREAAEYIVDALEEYGADGTIEEFEGYISVPEDATLEVTTPTQRTFDEAITASFGASTPPSGIHGDVAHLEEITEESVESNDVEGSIVFSRGLPTPQIATLVQSAGAEVVVIESIGEDQLHEMIVTPVWGTPSLETADEMPDLPVVQITQEAGAWLKDRLDEGPVEATVRTAVTTELTTLPVPLGRIDGRESDRYFVVGNHVDSWYEGVTDNATAMAATLEMARIFADHPPRRGLVFGFWPAHSTGRYAGSAWYADTNWLDLRENGVAYLHLDLNGLKGADRLYYQQMAELEAEGLDAMETLTDFDLLPPEEQAQFRGGIRPGRRGDMSFWGSGLSCLQIGARLPRRTKEGGPIGGGWWWHTPHDTRDKVDMDVLVDETQLYTAIASRICNSVVLPHDYTATAEDVRTNLQEIEAQASTSFEDINRQVDQLDEALAQAYTIIDDADADSSPALLAAIEDLQVDLGNLLVPALYMQRPEYEHDPAVPQNRLPYLKVASTLDERSGRDRRFAETTLQRGRTKLHHRLLQATARTRRFLDHHAD